jgi:hypothetical protein
MSTGYDRAHLEPCKGPLRWHSFGPFERQAWSTEAGKPAAHWFIIEPTAQGFRLRAQQNGTGAPALEVLSIYLNHRDWTIAQVQAIAEALRPTLPELGPESWVPIADIEARIAAANRLPTHCRFVHAFPLGANDSTVCLCNKVTKGYYESMKGAKP